MNLKKMEAVIIAIPTSMLSNEDIDLPSLNNLVDFCISEGGGGIMIAGTIGKSLRSLTSKGNFN